MASFGDKRYPHVQQNKYALILQNRNTEGNQKGPLFNINESNVNLTSAHDINLFDLYTQAQKFPDTRKSQKQKVGKIVKTTRDHQLVEKLSVKRSRQTGNFLEQNLTFEERKKKSGDRKPKLDTLPHDLTTAITLGQKMITKFNKRSRMKCNNLFTSSTTPTSNAKNSLKTTINNSINQNSFKVNKSFLNKTGKTKQ